LIPLTSAGQSSDEEPSAQELLNSLAALQTDPLSDDICPAYVRYQVSLILERQYEKNRQLTYNGRTLSVVQLLRKSKEELAALRVKVSRELAVVYTDILENQTERTYPIECDNSRGLISPRVDRHSRVLYNPLKAENPFRLAEYILWLLNDPTGAVSKDLTTDASGRRLIMKFPEIKQKVIEYAKEVVPKLLQQKELSFDDRWFLRSALTVFWIPPAELGLSLKEATDVMESFR